MSAHLKSSLESAGYNVVLLPEIKASRQDMID